MLKKHRLRSWRKKMHLVTNRNQNHILESSDNQNSKARITINDILIESSMKSVKLCIATWMEGNKSVLTEKKKFEYRAKLLILALFGRFGIGILNKGSKKGRWHFLDLSNYKEFDTVSEWIFFQLNPLRLVSSFWLTLRWKNRACNCGEIWVRKLRWIKIISTFRNFRKIRIWMQVSKNWLFFRIIVPRKKDFYWNLHKRKSRLQLRRKMSLNIEIYQYERHFLELSERQDSDRWHKIDSLSIEMFATSWKLSIRDLMGEIKLVLLEESNISEKFFFSNGTFFRLPVHHDSNARNDTTDSSVQYSLASKKKLAIETYLK